MAKSRCLAATASMMAFSIFILIVVMRIQRTSSAVQLLMAEKISQYNLQKGPRNTFRFSKLANDFAPEGGFEYVGPLPPRSWSLDNFDGQNFVEPSDAMGQPASYDGEYWLAVANSEATDCMMETGDDSLDCVADPAEVRFSRAFCRKF